jgi:hypothetical protein
MPLPRLWNTGIGSLNMHYTVFLRYADGGVLLKYSRIYLWTQCSIPTAIRIELSMLNSFRRTLAVVFGFTSILKLGVSVGSNEVASAYFPI